MIELEFAQALLKNGFTVWVISGKKYGKDFFLMSHKREDVIEYREIFLNEMKSLLPYFAEFFEDDTMVPKEYPDDFVGERPD